MIPRSWVAAGRWSHNRWRQPSCSRHGDFTTVNENEMSLSNAAGKASIENEAQLIQEL